MVDVLLLNWNELDVSKDSVRRLLKENVNIIVVDNGSTDGSKEYFRSINDPKFRFIDLSYNMGSSVGRNIGLEASNGKYIFLLDGDILYVKGTIAEYQKILDTLPDAFCVGHHSSIEFAKTGNNYNGTLDPIEADIRISTDYKIEKGVAMAWTQYGLFKGDLLRKVKFYDKGVFGKPGWGFEDNWLLKDMNKLGFESYSVDKPLYYHYAHSGIRELLKSEKNTQANSRQRKKEFEEKWIEKVCDININRLY